MSLVDDPASFLREKFAESFRAETSIKMESEGNLEKKEEKNVESETVKEVKHVLDVKELKETSEGSSTKESEVNPVSSTLGTEVKTESAEKIHKCQENIVDEETTSEKEDQQTKSSSETNFEVKSEDSKCDATPIGEELVDIVIDNDENEKEIDKDNDNKPNDMICKDDRASDETETKTEKSCVYDFKDDSDKDKLLKDKNLSKSPEDKVEENCFSEGDDKVKLSNTEDKLNEPETEMAKDLQLQDSEDKAKEVIATATEIGSAKEENIRTENYIKKEATANSKDIELSSQLSRLQRSLNIKKSSKEESLKHALPDLEIIQPWARLQELDQFLWRDRCSPAPSEPSLAQLIAHSYQNPIKWPRDHAVLVRLQHIIHAVEYKEWPAPSNFSAYSAPNLSISSLDFDNSARNTPEGTLKRDSSTPLSLPEGSEVITITTDHTPKHHVKKKKHHIAIDVETERAKLHALLNCAALGQSQHQNLKSLAMWDAVDESLSEDSRRSTPVSLQPPPAHQQTSRAYTNMSSNLALPFDLSKFHSPAKIQNNTSIVSNSLAPMDLSSSLSKSDPFKGKESETQNMSIAQDLTSKHKQVVSSQKSKLENTLDKLLKRKNCPPEEPIVDKEKKRRKLDAIVLGLSAAKEQQNTSLLADSKKPTCISPSVTVTPASTHPPSSNTPATKPFTITVTSVPGSSSTSSESDRKKDISSFLAQAEQQHNKLIKQQQQILQHQQNMLQQQALSSLNSSQPRKTYEAMVADLSKVADFSKIGSYPHDAKVTF